jgi:hypothetical protein
MHVPIGTQPLPPQHSVVAGLQQILSAQHSVFGGQHWPGVTGHGTCPGGHGAVWHSSFTHSWLESQQIPLQQTGLAMPQKVSPQGAPKPHWPFEQTSPFVQHWLPQMIPKSQQTVPLLMQPEDEQQVPPQLIMFALGQQRELWASTQNWPDGQQEKFPQQLWPDPQHHPPQPTGDVGRQQVLFEQTPTALLVAVDVKQQRPAVPQHTASSSQHCSWLGPHWILQQAPPTLLHWCSQIRSLA